MAIAFQVPGSFLVITMRSNNVVMKRIHNCYIYDYHEKNGPLVTCNGFPGHNGFSWLFNKEFSPLSLSHPLFGGTYLGAPRAVFSCDSSAENNSNNHTSPGRGTSEVHKQRIYLYRGEEWKTGKVPLWLRAS